MKPLEIKGVVLRTTDISESDRMLTIYSEQRGLISACAKGARSLKSRKMSSSQQFCYSSFVLIEQGDKCWVREASPIESFFGLREDIERLALAGYIAEVVDSVGTADPEPELLRLTLNSLFAIANGRADLPRIKAAFEMRALAILGFMPDILACHTCGERMGEFYFDIMAGAIECRECHKRSENNHSPLTDPHESHIIALLSEGAKIALGYAIYSPLEKLFSFSIGDEDMHLFGRAAESYLLNHLERGFKTLDFYNEVKR